MKNYRWENTSESGYIEANSKAHAKVKLLLQNIVPNKIWRDYHFAWFKHQQKRENELNLLQQLALILPSNIPIEKALKILSQQDHLETKLLCKKILIAIHAGSSLSLALATNTSLPQHYLSMLSLAEQQGTIITTLEKIYLRIESQKQIKSQITKATFYPLLLLLTGIAVCFIMIYCLLPNLQEFYQSNHAVLPRTTQYLLSLSSLSFYQTLMPFALLIFLFWIIYKILFHSKYRILYDKLLLHFPLIGKIIHHYQILSIFSLLDESLAAGVTLDYAWAQIIPTISNQYLQKQMKEIYKKLEIGYSFYQAIIETKLFPYLALSLLMIAEDTGQYPNMLHKLASIYEKIFQDLLHKTLRWLEPMLLLIMTGLIGFIVISVYSPLFNLGNVM